MKRFQLLLLGGFVAAAAAACSSKPETTPAPVAAAPPDTAGDAARRAAEEAERARQDAARRAAEEAERAARQRTADSLAAIGRGSEAVRTLFATMIHFDFDKANIHTDDAAILDQKVSVMQANPQVTIRVTGNCDERGSDEYNLALGNRRAVSAKQYLTSHGIDAGRIATASNGKEKPIDSGHNEAAWAKNRNDQFDIVAGGDVLKQP
jgi:peptidoglycan-associated lipoprotein